MSTLTTARRDDVEGEERQQADREHEVGQDRRRHGHHLERGSSAMCRASPDREQRAEHGGDHRRADGDDQRVAEPPTQCRRCAASSPYQRGAEAAPREGGAASVERQHDQHRRSAGTGRPHTTSGMQSRPGRRPDGRGRPSHVEPPPSMRRDADDCADEQHHQHHDDEHREDRAERPVPRLEELVARPGCRPSTVLPPPSSSGMTKLPRLGMNTRIEPVIAPGSVSGSVTLQNVRSPCGAQVGGGLDDLGVDLLDRRRTAAGSSAAGTRRRARPRSRAGV